MKPSLTIIVATTLVLFSCASVRQIASTPPITAASMTEQLQKLVSSPSPQEAFPLIASYRRSGELPPTTIEKYTTDGIHAMEDHLKEALKQKEFARASIYLHSLEALDSGNVLPTAARSTGTISMDELRLKSAEKHLSMGNDPAALSLFLRIQHPHGIVDQKLLEKYGRIAMELNDREGLSRIIALLRSLKQSVPADFSRFVKAQVDQSTMLKGMVTIVVNRGIQMQNGIGYADTVIGSGFFVDKRGYLITNYHVISSEVDPEYKGYSRLFVERADHPGTKYPAHVVGYSHIFDVALLKVDIKPSYVFSFVQKHGLRAGTPVVAMGSPGGLDNTVTSGIVSATGRRFMQMGDQIQMDVPVNPGNSGGPLLDSNGDVVGIVFAGIAKFQGVNFAIPSYWISKLLPELYETGNVPIPWMGAGVVETETGLTVAYVAPDSPAHTAGIRENDVISRIDGHPVTKTQDAQDILVSRPVRSLVTISWKHNGKSMDGLLVTEPRKFKPLASAIQSQKPEELFPALFGMDAKPVKSTFQRLFQVSRVYPGSIADETGLIPQDVFRLIDWKHNVKQNTVTIRIVVRSKDSQLAGKTVEITAPTQPNNLL